MPKSDELKKYSTASEVMKKKNAYLGKDVALAVSSRKDKKWMVQKPDKSWVHFGQMGAQDFTKHKNAEIRKLYLARATNIKGDWAKDKYSANNLAIHLLW